MFFSLFVVGVVERPVRSVRPLSGPASSYTPSVGKSDFFVPRGFLLYATNGTANLTAAYNQWTSYASWDPNNNYNKNVSQFRATAPTIQTGIYLFTLNVGFSVNCVPANGYQTCNTSQYVATCFGWALFISCVDSLQNQTIIQPNNCLVGEQPTNNYTACLLPRPSDNVNMVLAYAVGGTGNSAITATVANGAAALLHMTSYIDFSGMVNNCSLVFNYWDECNTRYPYPVDERFTQLSFQLWSVMPQPTVIYGN